MSKGLSPIIATMLLIGITISIGTVASIWMRSQSQEYMFKEGEHRERILNKQGEGLVLVHVVISGGNPVLTLQNNGTSDLEVAYVKINEIYRSQDYLTCSFADCELRIDESGTVTVDMPAAVTLSSIRSIEVGTVLGSMFIFNAPSAQIRIINTYFGEGNRLVTFSGEGSQDDGQIISWEWCFYWDDTNGCLDFPAPFDPDTDAETGYGAAVSCSYPVPTNTDTTYTVVLTVTDDTGMVGSISISFTIPA